MEKMKNLIFDFDGTLVDTAPVILATMQAAIKELGLPSKTEEECRSTIGLRLEEIPAVLWKNRDDLSATYAATYRRIFDELKRPIRVECFPGVDEGLKKLHAYGYRIAIASSRSHKSLDEYVTAFGWGYLLDAVVGGNDVEHGKPAPDAVLVICRKLGWKPEECLMTGDAIYDILMGKNAGTATCGVAYGNQDRRQLKSADPDFIVNEFKELVDRLI